MLVVTMDTSPPYEERYLETFEVSSSTSSSIQVSWHLGGATMPFVEAFQVHYQKVASAYIQHGPMLSPGESTYEIENLVADTYYRVCLVIFRNDTSPFRECVDASTTNWQLPVSLGSSIGAILALSMIVLIVLLSRCKIPFKYKRQKSKRSNKYDTMSSNFPEDHFDFSETYTHGNDDDFTSELGHDDDGFCEPSLVDTTTKQRPCEKVTLPNGAMKGNIHAYQQSQQRNSLGRIHYHPHGHSHVRPIRAYSIQADGQVCYFNQPCSPLAKDDLAPKLEPNAATRHKEWRHQQRIDDVTSQRHERYTSNPRRVSLQDHSPHPPLKISSDLFKHSIDNTHQDFLDRATNIAFTYMDEAPDLGSKQTAKPKQVRQMTPPHEVSPSNDNVCTDALKFDDLSAFGAVGGVRDSSVLGQGSLHHWDKQHKPVELVSKRAMIDEPERDSFEEHTV